MGRDRLLIEIWKFENTLETSLCLDSVFNTNHVGIAYLLSTGKLHYLICLFYLNIFVCHTRWYLLYVLKTGHKYDEKKKLL